MSDGRDYTLFPRGITFLIMLAGCLSARLCEAQKIAHVDFQVVGNEVIINYDIDACSGERTYDVRVLLGMDGKLTEIKRGLHGDVENVGCGSSNTISWDVLSDRGTLKGRIYFTVEIVRTHLKVMPSSESSGPSHGSDKQTRDKGGKEWARRSWKADKGWVGGSIGVFAPYAGYSAVPYDWSQGGFFINATMGYLPTLFLGLTSTVYIYSPEKRNAFDIGSSNNFGVMIGPLISLPIGNSIKWDVRPQIGYSSIAVASDLSRPDSLNTVRAGVACSFSTGLRLNVGKRTCYMLNVEYLSAPIKLNTYSIETNLGTVGASFGIAFRFY